jgi:hypothetical protein
MTIAPTSFFFEATDAPLAATPESAKELLVKYNADLTADKFDKEDISFNGYENFLNSVIERGGIHPAFPSYPKFK